MKELLVIVVVAFSAACSASSGQPVSSAAPESRAVLEPETAPEPATVLTEVEPSWYDKSAALADRHTIQEVFEKRGYQPPGEAYLLIGRISKIAGKPAYTWFSLGDTGFDASADSFWPASMVKLAAAVGALETLHAHGLTGSANISFTDGRGEYKGSASRLYGSALSHSSNVAYDRLMKIAGFDNLNEHLLNPENGFPFMTMQCPFDQANDESLRDSPAIEFTQRKLVGIIPERTSTQVHEQCPEGANCATLFELLHLLQRVVLHDELDEGDRFNLHRSDKKALRRYLEKAPSRIAPGIQEALGHPITVYNKGGRVPDMVANDHALVVDEENGRRYLVAASIAEEDDKDETRAGIAELVRRGMNAVAYRTKRGFAAAGDGGIPIEFSWEQVGKESYFVDINVAAEGEFDSMVLYEGSLEIARSTGEPIHVKRPNPDETLHLYVAIARKGKRIVGYKNLGLISSSKRRTALVSPPSKHRTTTILPR
jgi:beta-lactamase family protein